MGRDSGPSEQLEGGEDAPPAFGAALCDAAPIEQSKNVIKKAVPRRLTSQLGISGPKAH